MKDTKKIKQNTAKNTRTNIDKIKTMTGSGFKKSNSNLHIKEQDGVTDIQLKPKNVMKTV